MKQYYDWNCQAALESGESPGEPVGPWLCKGWDGGSLGVSSPSKVASSILMGEPLSEVRGVEERSSSQFAMKLWKTGVKHS